MIFFDIDGTLLDDRAAIAAGLDALHARHAAALGPRDELEHLWRRLLDRHFPRFLRGEISMQEQRRERMRGVFGNRGVDDLDAAFEIYLEGYERGWTRFPDVVDVLAGLAAPLGVITNGSREQQTAKLVRSGIAPLFSLVVTSEECGVAKPDRRIFVEACRRAGVAVADAVYVGDDRDTDIAGSLAAGLRPVWLRRGTSPPHEIAPGVCVIDTLYDLPAALASARPRA